MDLLTVWFHLFPWLSLVGVVCLVAITVWMWVPRPNAAAKAYKDGVAAGYERGRESGHAAGYLDGVEENHLEEAHFIKCPEPGCDKAIEVPTIMHVDQVDGKPRITCSPDTTELWVHIEGHKANG